MPQENLLSLQKKFNNLGSSQLENERDRFAMTDRPDRNEWNAQRNQNAFNRRNTTAPGNQQFKKRSNSNIGKGSRLASNPRNYEEDPPRIGKSSMSYVQQQKEAERISRLSFNSGGNDMSSPSILDTWN